MGVTSVFEISPSLSAGSLLDLGKVLRETAGLDHIHLDVDDGNFVHGISFGLDTVEVVAKNTAVPLDVHLEVLNPLDYVDRLGEIGVSAVCAHVEALPFPSEFVGAARNAGIGRVGLAINVKTPVDEVLAYADQVDYLLFVSVEADRRGLQMRPFALEKLRRARALLGVGFPLWADGGINESNLRQVVEAGASGVVVGRAVFGQADPVAAARRLVALGRSCQEELEP